MALLTSERSNENSDSCELSSRRSSLPEKAFNEEECTHNRNVIVSDQKFRKRTAYSLANYRSMRLVFVSPRLCFMRVPALQETGPLVQVSAQETTRSNGDTSNNFIIRTISVALYFTPNGLNTSRGPRHRCARAASLRRIISLLITTVRFHSSSASEIVSSWLPSMASPARLFSTRVSAVS